MWIQYYPIIGKSQSTLIWSGHTYCFQATKQLPCCRYLDVLRLWDLGWSGKVPVSRKMVLLIPWFLVLDLNLRLKVRDVEIELKVLVYYILMGLFCNLITWLPYIWNGSIKNILEVSGFLNCMTFLSSFFLLFWSHVYCALGKVGLKSSRM